MAKERLKIEMSIKDVLLTMCDGNPGALTACINILEMGEEIDPDSGLGGYGVINSLDKLNIYGHRIYGLWNDVCKRDVGRMIAVLRANQLGQLIGINKEVIDHAIDNWGEGIDLEKVVSEVKKRLPNFNTK